MQLTRSELENLENTARGFLDKEHPAWRWVEEKWVQWYLRVCERDWAYRRVSGESVMRDYLWDEFARWATWTKGTQERYERAYLYAMAQSGVRYSADDYARWYLDYCYRNDADAHTHEKLWHDFIKTKAMGDLHEEIDFELHVEET